MTTIDYGERFDAAIADSLDPFQPTEFGESLMWHIVKLVCMTAPPPVASRHPASRPAPPPLR